MMLRLLTDGTRLGILLLGLLLALPLTATAQTYTVDVTADFSDAITGDGVCATASGTCTLRAAIQEANATSGMQTITFNIPGSDGGCADGTCVIEPVTALPDITGPVVIDGAAQPGSGGVCTNAIASRPVYGVALDGTNAGTGAHGLTLAAGTNGSTIRGLNVRAFGGYGILISGGTGSRVQCSFLGTDAAGITALGNGKSGVGIENAASHIVGTDGDGTDDGNEGNLLSGNSERGTFITGASASGNVIAGNFAGTDKTGQQALPNGEGVFAFNAPSNRIGTDADGTSDAHERNVVSGNTGRGVRLLGPSALGNVVAGNLIGLAADGVTLLGNGVFGVEIARASDSRIGSDGDGVRDDVEGNHIAGNSGDGVKIIEAGQTALNNAVLRNAIFSNGGEGINLEVAGNDPGDADTGANNRQNTPEMASVYAGSGVLRVDYTVDTAVANATYPLRVEFFLADADGEEGQTFVGAHSYAQSNAQQQVSALFTAAATVADGDLIVATATDGDGNTSEFSAAVAATPFPPFAVVVDATGDEADASIGDGTCATAGGTCTLRAALEEVTAQGGDATITFDAAVTGTINLTGALSDLSTNVEIRGPGADVLTIQRSTGGDYRIFRVTSGTAVTLSGLTIRNGKANQGGGILNDGGTLTVERCVIRNNQSRGTNAVHGGGGIYGKGGTLTVTRSTFLNNFASMHGGAIYKQGTATITGSTFSRNESGFSGGAINNYNGSLAVTNTTFGENVNQLTAGGIYARAGTVSIGNTVFKRDPNGGSRNLYAGSLGTFVSLGYNLCDNTCQNYLNATGDQMNTDPMLGGLNDHGGPMPTYLPQPGSPVIDVGTCQFGSITEDQRGEPRPYDAYDDLYPDADDGCDVGAVEAQPMEVVVESTVVTTTADEDDGTSYPGFGAGTSLREAIAHNAAGSTITFDPSLDGQTIALTQGQLVIPRPLTVDASSLADGLTVDAQQQDVRVFEVTSGTSSGDGAVLVGLTITGGKPLDDVGIQDVGGGIRNRGTLTLRASLVVGNEGRDGGGIESRGALTLQNTTLSGNIASIGSGLLAHWGGSVLIENSTVAGNRSSGSSGGGGGEFGSGSGDDIAVVIRNSVFADNGTGRTGCIVYTGDATVTHTFVELIQNIEPSCITPGVDGNATGDALLGPLADNGGPTRTHLPQAVSPLIDAGDPTTCLASDQRGETRPDRVGGTCDIGAVEVQDLQPSTLVVDTATDGADDGECASDCTLREAIALVAEGGTITFDAALDGATIDLTQGQLQITRPLTVDASALTNGLTVDATGKEHRVMDVTSGTASGEGAVIIGLTISGGSSIGIPEAKAPSGVQVTDLELGGGIRNSGQLRLERSTLTGNRGELDEGSAIWSSGTLTLLRSTLTNNQNFHPSDEVVISGGTLTLQSSTISDDGILNQGGVVTVEASTLIGDQPDPALRNVGGSLTLTNSVASEIAGCTGTTVSHSLIEDGSCITPGVDGNLTGDPILGLLADYGGPTLTHLPMSISPLIDAGDPAACPAEDQRGETRPFDGDSDGTAACDIGAVERSESDALSRSSLVVDTATDEADDGECDVDCTLREAIALVNNNLFGGTITFDTGVTGTINLTGALPVLSTDITIQGPGADVLTVRRDTGGNYRIFIISSGSVGAISGLTISGGSGGIRNDGVLTVTNSTISGNNTASGDGGGIDNGGTLTVTGSTISGNTARLGGGISNVDGQATVNSSTISGNTADIFGGGILLASGTLTVNSSTITGNTADPDGLNGGEGGGLWNGGSSPQATLRNSIVAGNVLGASTPDDVANSGTVTSQGYNLVGEDGEGLFAATGDQTGTVAAPLDPLLGPLRDNGGPTLTHLPLSSSPAIDAGDTALTEDQRGVARPQEGTDDIGAVERSAADDLALVVDTATDGADDGECASDCTLREAIALANADPDRAVITFDAGVTGTITLASALPDLVTDITIQGPGAGTLAVDGGGAYRVFTIAGSGGVAISGLTISGGSADNGGGLHNSGTLTLDSSTISGNTGSDDGGGVYNVGTLTVSRSTITGNTASSEDGGGIYNSGTVVVSTSTISGNTAGSDGGGIYDSFGTLTLHRSTITANTANRGGGIYDSFGTLTVGGSIVADNDGGDNIVKIGPTPLTSEGYNLIGDNNGAFNATGDRINTSARLGPLQDNGGPTLTHLPLSSSPAINGGDPATCSGTDQRGQPRPDPVDSVCDIGAVERQDPPPLTLVVDTTDDVADDGECASDCTLREALALVPYGGTITFDAGVTGTINLNSALPDLSNVTIQGPGADVLTVRRNAGPGGNYFTIFTIPSGRTVAISGLTLTNGHGDYAGGIYNLGTLTLTSSTITGNESLISGEGGGIQNRGTLTVTSSTISENTVNENGGGGGILNRGTLTVTSSTISGNSTFDVLINPGGGGIRNDGTLTIIGSTISGNSATGEDQAVYSGGIYNTGGTVTLRNTIVAGNLGDSTPDDIFRAGGTITSEGYNLVGEDGEGLFTATGDQTGTEAAPLDPLLGALQDNGGPTLTHLPQAGSPALDAGSCPSATEDQRGETRPYDIPATANAADGCDIGAVERQADDADDGLTVAASLWLEGPWNGSAMNRGLSDHLSQSDPYSLGQSVASADFFTTDPDGQNVTDWLWLELRTGDPSSSMTTVATSAALLLSNGSIKDMDATSNVSFDGVASGSYYLVVGHRNHLSVMSATAVACSSGSCSYNFTTAQSTAYTQGADPLTDLSGSGTGPFALLAADGDADGLIGAGDQTLWLSGRGSSLGYHAWDFDLDGLTGSSDQTLWLSNRGQGSQVPAAGAVAAPVAKQAAVPLRAPVPHRIPNKSSH